MTTNASIPVLHYLDIGRLGRGELIILFLKDAGIEYEYVRHAYDETWPETSARLREQKISRTGKVPALEYKGLTLTQHIAILRYLARDLGKYDGETNEEKYLVDVVADLHNDWRIEWAANLKGVKEQYKNEYAPKFYNLLAEYYSEHGGPYLLGERITYADFAIYQSIDNDERIGTLPATLPEAMIKFRKAIEARPNLSAYLKETAATKA